MSGIGRILLPLLFALAGQEPSLEALLEQLSDDRVEQREAAVESLVRLGAKRLPELQARLDGLPPEPKARLAVAIRRLEDSVRVLEYLPLYRPVSLTLDRMPIREAMKELADRSGLPINLSTCPDGREVTVKVEDVPPLQALNELCRAALLGWMETNPADWRGRRANSQPPGIRIHEVVPYYHRPKAVQYLRHYRIRAHLSTVTYNEGGSRQQLNLSIQPSPGVRPHSTTGVRFAEARNEKGEDILASLPSASGDFGILGIGRISAGYTRTFPATETPQKLTRLRGTVTFRYPREVLWVEFLNPGDGAGASQTGLGCRFSLSKYRREGSSHEVVLRLTRLDGPPSKRVDFEKDLPFNYQEVEVVTASGERLASSGCSAFGGGATWEIHLTMKGSKDEAAATIRIPWAERFIDDVVEFDLRDVVPQ